MQITEFMIVMDVTETPKTRGFSPFLPTFQLNAFLTSDIPNYSKWW